MSITQGPQESAPTKRKSGCLSSNSDASGSSESDDDSKDDSEDSEDDVDDDFESEQQPRGSGSKTKHSAKKHKGDRDMKISPDMLMVRDSFSVTYLC